MPVRVIIRSSMPPVVEIDTEAHAAYVRFKRRGTRVVRTEELSRMGATVVVDFDRDDEVIGVELVGVREFGAPKLLELARVRVPNADLTRARYVGAGRGELAAAG